MQCTATLKRKMTNFYISQKQLCIIVTTASLRRFKQVPTFFFSTEVRKIMYTSANSNLLCTNGGRECLNSTGMLAYFAK